MIPALAVILLFQLGGEALSRGLSLPVPGPVIVTLPMPRSPATMKELGVVGSEVIPPPVPPPGSIPRPLIG